MAGRSVDATVESWHDFAVMLGGASAALTGLLFVAVSVNAARIAGHAGLRAWAAQTLVLFLIPLIWAMLMLTPDQGTLALGVELAAMALLAGLVLLGLSRQRHSRPEDSAVIARLIEWQAPTGLLAITLLVSGVLVAVGWAPGFYFAVPALIVAIFTGVLTAWLTLLAPSE
jgi:hypothetical protein